MYLREGYGLTADDARANDNEALRWASRIDRLDVLEYLCKSYGLSADE